VGFGASTCALNYVPTFPSASSVVLTEFISVLIGLSMLIAEAIMFVRLYALSGRSKMMLGWICVQLIVESIPHLFAAQQEAD
jgi:hypothetical protein